MLGEVDTAVAGGFFAQADTAEHRVLAGEDAAVFTGNGLVVLEQIGDFPRTDADIAGGNVHIGADKTRQLCHEALAKAENLSLAVARGVKVRATLGAAHGQPGQAVLEGLLETEKVQDAEVQFGGKTQTALVGSQGIVELDPVAAVGLHPVVVVQPVDAKIDHPVGLDQLVKDMPAVFPVVRVDIVGQILDHFLHRLVVLRHMRVFVADKLLGFGGVGGF